MCKLLLIVIGHVLGRVPFDDTSQTHDQGGPDGNCGSHSPVNRISPLGIFRSVNCVFSQGVELMIRNVAKKLAAYIDDQVSRTQIFALPVFLEKFLCGNFVSFD